MYNNEINNKNINTKKNYLIISIIIIIIIAFLVYDERGNSLEITKTDEKTILQYLDTKTNDINEAREGKMYSAFTILGTDKDKVYVYLSKEGYFKEEGKLGIESGVSLPVVLYIQNGKNGIEITNHKYPEDGIGYVKSEKKLFPYYVRCEIKNNYNERADKLQKIIKNKAEKDFKN
ncbi:hypothetical protein KPL35_18115 [Clostridium sp. CF011]|uniref:hypothetical protein n=1 Tax=Clostridium sp. CF011 TaxID=2843318 RepID=UPI001C0B7D87|nr:hypothetical protein [Clostridium sp. CF011]MBU3093946.1 hypothetical protein [Clostridium sp. CF011]WAG70337.1 hypothetical protein LL036_02510 [Clostridium sp. CF011]